MNRKELTKTFMMISNWKNPLVAMCFYKLIQRFAVLGLTLHTRTVLLIAQLSSVVRAELSCRGGCHFYPFDLKICG